MTCDHRLKHEAAGFWVASSVPKAGCYITFEDSAVRQSQHQAAVTNYHSLTTSSRSCHLFFVTMSAPCTLIALVNTAAMQEELFCSASDEV